MINEGVAVSKHLQKLPSLVRSWNNPGTLTRLSAARAAELRAKAGVVGANKAALTKEFESHAKPYTAIWRQLLNELSQQTMQ